MTTKEKEKKLFDFKNKIGLFRLLTRLRQIANENEKIGDEERTLARFEF